MSKYEFVRDDGQEERPVSPEFWRMAPRQIYQIPYNELTLVSHYSIVHDNKTGVVGIDTKDPLPELPSHSSMPLIPVMRVMVSQGETVLDGFLIDARAKRNLASREIDFADPDEQTQELATMEPLGIVFADNDGKCHFMTRYYETLLPYMESMLQVVDAHTEETAVTEEGRPDLRPVFLRPAGD
jgi:hypothetical protein